VAVVELNPVPQEQYNKSYICWQGLKPMDAISYSTARAQLAGTMNKVCENHLSPASTAVAAKNTIYCRATDFLPRGLGGLAEPFLML